MEPIPPAHVSAEFDRARRVALGDPVLRLDVEDVLELLPQRPPQLLVDRVLSLVPGRHAVGQKTVTGNEHGLARRKHGFVFPATFALEFLVQLAAIVRHYPRRFVRRPDAGQKERRSLGDALSVDPLSILGAVESFEVRREMVAGGRMFGSVSILSEASPEAEGRWVRCAGQVHLASEPFVETTFDIVDLATLNGIGESASSG